MESVWLDAKESPYVLEKQKQGEQIREVKTAILRRAGGKHQQKTTGSPSPAGYQLILTHLPLFATEPKIPSHTENNHHVLEMSTTETGRPL
jgi:hypothetical protein